jgi:hypothetical protein
MLTALFIYGAIMTIVVIAAAFTETPSAASTYATWLQANRPARLTDANQIINEAQRNTYLLGEMMRAAGVQRTIRTGKHIEEMVRLRNQGNARYYVPGETRTTTRKPTTEKAKWGWRFIENDFSWTDAEIDLAEGDEYTVFKRFREHMNQELWTDHWEFLEGILTARPDGAAMEPVEKREGGKTHSIFSYVSENSTTFRPPAAVWDFTTIAGIATSEENWRNPIHTYDPANPDAREDGIFAAFDRSWLHAKFQQPPNSKSYYENDQLRALKIITNSNGSAIFQGLLRDGQDHFRAGPQDPSYGFPVFRGVPVIHISNLDTEPLEEVAGAYTGDPWPDGKPRYVGLNCKYTYPVFHPKHFMKEVGPISGAAKQRDAFSMFKVSWGNLVCRSRRRNFMVAPAG